MRKLFFICLVLVCGLVSVNAQSVVTGKVIDKKTKAPIEGAVIMVIGFKMPSVLTDASGIYTINIPEGAKTLQASYPGMKISTQGIGKKKSINFKLMPAVTNKNEKNNNMNKDVDKK
jgi:hypothetical protein